MKQSTFQIFKLSLGVAFAGKACLYLWLEGKTSLSDVLPEDKALPWLPDWEITMVL